MDDWRHSAGCRDEPPELFFAVGTSGPALLQNAEAKTVCNRCPVRAECLEYALGAGHWAAYGVWGGLDERERDQLKRARAHNRQVA